MPVRVLHLPDQHVMQAAPGPLPSDSRDDAASVEVRDQGILRIADQEPTGDLA